METVTLTKEQRRVIYISAKNHCIHLVEFELNSKLSEDGVNFICTPCGMCPRILLASNQRYNITLFPEFMSLKPKDKKENEFWWTEKGRESIDIRLEKFDEIIKMCE